jgi:hypothetical protein
METFRRSNEKFATYRKLAEQSIRDDWGFSRCRGYWLAMINPFFSVARSSGGSLQAC